MEIGESSSPLHRPLGIVAAIGKHIRGTIAAGLLVVIPFVITFLIFKVLLDWFDPILKPAFEEFLGEGDYKKGMGIGALIVLIYVAGLLTTHVIGRRLIRLGHRAVDVIPVVRNIYNTLLQATELLGNTRSSTSKYKGVVLVDFPRRGSKSIGLITSQVTHTDGSPALAVFVPTTPVPTSGFLIIVKEEEVTLTDLTIDEAMKIIVSTGILMPDHMLPPPEAKPSEDEPRTTEAPRPS